MQKATLGVTWRKQRVDVLDASREVGPPQGPLKDVYPRSSTMALGIGPMRGDPDAPWVRKAHEPVHPCSRWLPAPTRPQGRGENVPSRQQPK